MNGPEGRETQERPQPTALNQTDSAGALSTEGAQPREIEKTRVEPLSGTGVGRNPLTVLVLGFLTCYVYLFYWWYVTGLDIRHALGREETNPPVELALNLLTCSLYSIYLSYKYPKLIVEMEERAQVPPDDKSTVSVLLSLFSLGPIACYLIQTDLNRIWDRVKESGESRRV